MEVHAFLKVTFQDGAWKRVYAEAGRITYKANQEHSSLEVVTADGDDRLRFRVAKGTKVLISGNSVHLPDGLR